MSKSICTFFLSIFVLLFSNSYSISQERSVTYKGQQLKMTQSEGSLCIRYKDNTSTADMQKVFSKISSISSRKLEFTASSKTNSNYSVQVVTLKQNVTNNSELLRSTIELLRNNSMVDHVGSAYKYNDNILHFSLGEVIVKFRPNVSATEISNLNKLFKAVSIEKINTFDNTYLVRLDPASSDDVFDLANKYSITTFVEFAHPNFLRTGMLLEVPRDSTKHSKHTVKNNNSTLNSGSSTDYMPNDTLVPRMWNLNNTGTNFPLPWITGTPGCDMRMFQAWETTGGNPNVLISITDTGIDTNHTDLRPNLCDRSLWYDAYDNDQKPYDEYYHGTGVSGIAIAVGNNTAGVAGIAYNCKVMPVRVFGPYPAAFTTDLILAKGLNWSWIHGASVINCSWGGGIPGSLISMAIENAVNYGRNNRGAVVVGGSGNTDTNIVLYPASMPEVIGAGGLSPCNERKSTESCDNVGDSLQNWGACYGDGMEVVAPCSFIGTTELGGGWCICGNGTSDSSPMTAGVAGLIISKNINLSGDSVKMIIEKTARKVGNYSYDVQLENGMWNYEMGYGAVDAAAALDATPFGPSVIYDQVPPLLTIFPPESNRYSVPISVEAIITDNNGLNSASYSPRMYFRTIQSGQIQVAYGSSVGANRFRFTFPLMPYSEGMYYYLAAQDITEIPNFVTYPVGGAGTNPPGTTAPPKFMFVRNTDKYDTTLISTNIPIPITSERETSFVSILNNPVNKTVLDVNVLLNVQHTFDADLTLALISPSGTEIVLTGGVGLDGDNYTDTYFDDEADIAIDSSAALPPFTGRFKPIDKLWLFDGENSGGVWKLKVIDNGFQDGGALLGWSVIFKYSTGSDYVNIPGNFSLVKNYPNPFNPKTRILFNVPVSAIVKITIYDAAGREVKTVLNERRSPALEDFVDFDASDLASGVYFYSMAADGEFIESKKMVLIK